MGHISSWSVLVTIIYWVQISIPKIEALLEASREVVLKVNTEKTTYMLVSHHQNVGQNHHLLIADKSFAMWQSSSTWEKSNTSRLHSRRNLGQIKFGERLLPLSSESVFPSPLQKYED
jgi:hypothetical protein